MAADLTVEPFKRLAALAPQGTGAPDLQAAADRYTNTQDLYAAAADLWEEAALSLNITDTDAGTSAQVTSASQGDISVTYATRGSTQDNTFKTYNAYKRVAADFRRKSKPSTPLIIGADAIDRFEQDPYDFDPENGIIEVSNWGQ